MSILREKQSLFAQRIAVLRLVIYAMGYEITDGDAYRDPERVHYGHPRSCHKIRLAEDLNLFKNGKYLEGEEAAAGHNAIHDIWDKMGGAKRISNDLNHYSFEHEGMR